jgi:hypothetical protein
MVTIERVDFTKLKPYDGKVTKCFEHLCYQIAHKEFSHLGSFTAIDGSGGDGGVEFYLNLSNGEKWGWQCKYFGDTGRLSVGNRKHQIADSLETACRNHPNLTKWILCLKTDLTEDSVASDGIVSRGELYWFRNQLPNKIPSGRIVTLEHWGESSFVTFLNDKKHIGIRSFFFGDLEFDEDWFNKRFSENFEKVRDKYDPSLHSIDKYTQSKVDFLLFDTNYLNQTKELKDELLEKVNQIERKLYDFRDEIMISSKELGQRENFFLLCKGFSNHISFVFEKIDFIEFCFKSYNQELISEFRIEELQDNFFEYFNKIDFRVFDEKSSASRDASDIVYLLSEFGQIYNRFFRNYFHEQQNELHFLADAAKGKTHISCDIAYKRISVSKPAIFITGDKFTDETNISEAFRKILEIPVEFTFDEFLQALDIYGSILNLKVPIIIDGLNETIFNRLFSPIWKNHIAGFTNKISQSKNLVVVTTCRKSYANRIWDDTLKNEFHNLYGFTDYDTVLDAINKYFNKYRLKADLFFAPLERFRDPIFLKIFCEVRNPNWKSSREVEVNIEEESTYDIFTEYLNQVNIRVTNNSYLLRINEPFITSSLSKLSNYLWENNLREIPIQVFYSLIDGDLPYEKDKSKADILINEGLVLTRDMRDKHEYASFTYDILAGYIIGENLIRNNLRLDYLSSNKFIQKILNEKGQHPLSEDVISALCLLLPQLRQVPYHEVLTRDKLLNFTKTKVFKHLPKFITNKFSKRIAFSNYTFSKSITALFSQPARFVKGTDIKLLTDLFFRSDNNKETFFDLSFKTLSSVEHPLNATFLSDLLVSLQMNQRDISWTEYVRQKSYDIERYISEFESQCHYSGLESKIIVQKQHILSRIIVWFLTSTNRALRDDATRALYYYGRKFPKEFILLVCESLKYNDPYVWERTLASMYGVVMAEHNSLKSDEFREKILPDVGKGIYNLIFKEDAQHSTTHILARDYARRTIEICLIHHPKLLTEKEIINLRPPYSYGGIRNLGEFDYGDREFDYTGPIQMDFSNYTIGRIVKDGHSYSNPPEKIKVRKQIYWRIFDLGWEAGLFKEVEKSLSSDRYYRGRTARSEVERYGKKYSWIAYFENAGLRDDLGLLDKKWLDGFRISDADIDPSFPSNPNNEAFLKQDLLGDRAISLVEWYENGGMPFIEDYLSVKNLKGINKDWICLDSFILQEDMQSERHRFVFIRGFLVKENDYIEVVDHLFKQYLGGRWLPEKHENYYTFAGELYCFPESTYENNTVVEFITGKEKIKIKKGEPGYLQSFFWDYKNLSVNKEFPEEIEKEVLITRDYEIVLPVMEYNWESYHSSLNDAGHTSVVSKEIAIHLKLINQPQTFDLYESNGDLATINLYYYSNYNNNQSFVYIRKDLLDKYLSEMKFKFVWCIWGERDVRFKTEEQRTEFFKANPFKDYQVFQKIVKYT